MDKDRFDTIAKSLAGETSRRAAIGAIFGGAAAGLASKIDSLSAKGKKSSKGKKSNKGKSGGKIEICHNGNTISVSKKAWKAHQKHGDSLGPCKVTTKPPVTTKAPTTKPPTTQPPTTKPPVNCGKDKEWCEATKECVKADCSKYEYWDSEKCRCKQVTTPPPTTQPPTTQPPTTQPPTTQPPTTQPPTTQPPTHCGKSTSSGIPGIDNEGCVGACRKSKLSGTNSGVCNTSCQAICDVACPNVSGSDDRTCIEGNTYCTKGTFYNCGLAT